MDHRVERVLQTKEQARRYYDKLAPAYDLLSERSEQPMRAHGLALLAARAGERVLEIGCGTGHSLVALAQSVQPAGTVVGLDLSPRMLGQTRARVSAASRDAPVTRTIGLIRGDAEHLPLRNGSMAAVFTSFTLDLFDTPVIGRVLQECRRVLQPHGRIVAVSTSKVGSPEFGVTVYEWAHRHFPNLLDCRPLYLEEAIRAAGFTILEAKLEHMWVPVEIVLARV